jgi:acyl-CoA synthetase (AMP-forming)/AMP-acid ligase II
MNEKTLPELLRRRIALTPAAEAYRQFDAASGRWVGHSWADVGQRVSEYKRALGAEGLPAGVSSTSAWIRRHSPSASSRYRFT